MTYQIPAWCFASYVCQRWIFPCSGYPPCFLILLMASTIRGGKKTSLQARFFKYSDCLHTDLFGGGTSWEKDGSLVFQGFRAISTRWIAMVPWFYWQKTPARNKRWFQFLPEQTMAVGVWLQNLLCLTIGNSRPKNVINCLRLTVIEDVYGSMDLSSVNEKTGSFRYLQLAASEVLTSASWKPLLEPKRLSRKQL